jgi:tetratricopeptide (TPR) repeat protein
MKIIYIFVMGLGLMIITTAFSAAKVAPPACQILSKTINENDSYFALIECYRSHGDFETAYHVFKDSTPPSAIADSRKCIASQNLLNSYLKAFPKNSEAVELKSYLMRSCADFGSSPVNILWERGKALFDAGKYDDAQKYFARIHESYADSEYGTEAGYYVSECMARLKGSNANPPSQGNATLEISTMTRSMPLDLSAGIVDYEDHLYASARIRFKKVIHEYPYTRFAAKAQFYDAECAYRLGNKAEAEPGFKSFYTTWPFDDLAPEALLQRAEILVGMGKSEQVYEILAHLEFLKAKEPLQKVRAMLALH